jgi:hypothetical protein
MVYKLSKERLNEIARKKTYMCDACGWGFEQGYWLDIGEIEKLFLLRPMRRRRRYHEQ